MKAYVAARLHAKLKVHSLYAQLLKLGYEISHDWTAHKNVKPYQQNLLATGQYALADLNGVKDADVFIFLTDPEISAGSSAELGAALALNMIRGMLRILLISNETKNNLVLFLSCGNAASRYRSTAKRIGHVKC